MLDFSIEAHDALEQFCNSNKIDFISTPLKRIGSTQEEKVELVEGDGIFKIYGFDPKKITWKNHNIHFTGEKSVSTSGSEILDALKKDAKYKTLLNHVSKLDEKEDHICLTLDSGETIEAEMVVLANHEKISNLVPFYKDVLIPYADQWNTAVISSAFLKNGEMALWKYSNIWAKAISDIEIIFGGARFLKPSAGIEQRAEIDPNVSAFISGELKQIFDAEIGEIISSHPFMGIRSCDERPVIGPHFGSGRILLAAGYMGNAMTLGFYAGKCLAEIITNGSSKKLPRFLTPERLRSLAKSD
jgi:glycine/D-amino acid oxidase-like deaminating enzyme